MKRLDFRIKAVLVFTFTLRILRKYSIKKPDLKPNQNQSSLTKQIFYVARIADFLAIFAS